MDGPSFWPAGATSHSDGSADSPVATPAAQLHELSAFLASAEQPPASSTLLDELLGHDDGEQLPMAARALAPVGGAPFHATARLLQLEDNYERKKKRAKINRKDLNARFQELMELLGLREDRKLNRAKVLEKAIEHIEKLEAELQDAKAQLAQAAHGSDDAARAKHPTAKQPTGAAMMPVPVPVRRLPTHATTAGMHHIGSTPMVPIATGPHAWTSATASGLPLTSMVWVPCPVVGHPMTAGLSVATSNTSTSPTSFDKRRSLKRTREGTIDADAVTSSSHPSSPTAEKRIAPQSPVQTATSWAVHEIPTVLEYCDAWTLANVMQTCKELERAARREDLWAMLVQRRWRITMASPRRVPAFQQWAVWHISNRMPDCSAITSAGFHFATGRKHNVNTWGLLIRRSNGRTTRTVLVDGRATVMQVVEVNVVVQNMGQTRVRLTDQIAVSSEDAHLATPFTTDSGAHLTPHIVAVNSETCTMAGVAGVELHHGDTCVLSVFLHCEGLDLEDEFLHRAHQLHVRVECGSPGGSFEQVEVVANCHSMRVAQHFKPAICG